MMKCPGSLICLVALAGCNALSGDRADFPEMQPISPLGRTIRAVVSVAGNSRRVKTSGGIVLELKLVNVSRTDAMLYSELRPGRAVVIDVLRADGKVFRSPAPDKSDRPRRGKYHYVSLPPGGFVGRRYIIRPADPRWELSPGRYRVRVIYRNGFKVCPVRPGLTEEDIGSLRDKALVRLLTGLVVSNVETFRVVAD